MRAPRAQRAANLYRVPAIRAAMALEEALLAFWFLLPAYVANPMAVVFGGGTPMDFGRTLRDGRRILGDGKTWRGFAGGGVSGVVLGLLLNSLGSLSSPRSSFGGWPGGLRVLVLLPVGGLLGDLLRPFVQRRPRVREDFALLRRHQEGNHAARGPAGDRPRHREVRAPRGPDCGRRARRRPDRGRHVPGDREALHHGPQRAEGARHVEGLRRGPR